MASNEQFKNVRLQSNDPRVNLSQSFLRLMMKQNIEGQKQQKFIKSMRLEDDLKKIHQFKRIKKSMKKSQQQLQQLQKQIQKVENYVRQTKQSVIKKHLLSLQQRKKQRSVFIKQSNKAILEIIKKSKEKTIQEQQIKKKQKQVERQKIEKVKKQKKQRYRNPINFTQLQQHQSRYVQLKSSMMLNKKQNINNQREQRRSVRVKSQISSKYENQFENLSIDHKSMLDERIRDQYRQLKNRNEKKKIQLMKLIEKRNQYGNRVEIEKRNQKLKTQVYENRIQKQMKEYWDKIYKENYQKIKMKKPRVNTNLPQIKIEDSKRYQLKKISIEKSSDLLKKLQKLKKIQQSYSEKLKYNNPESVDLLVEISLTKADLLLKN